MISSCTPPTLSAASISARACVRVRSGCVMPSCARANVSKQSLDAKRRNAQLTRQPRWPLIDCDSCSASRRRSMTATSTPRCLAISSVWRDFFCGRNSCSGGSSRRTVIGLPSTARKSASKSLRCRSSSAFSDLARMCSSRAKIISRTGNAASVSNNGVVAIVQRWSHQRQFCAAERTCARCA